MFQAQETVAGFAPLARHKFLTFDPDFSLPEVQVHRPPPRVSLECIVIFSLITSLYLKSHCDKCLELNLPKFKDIGYTI